MRSDRQARRTLALAALLCLAALAGCVSFGKSAPSRFYLLNGVIPPAGEAGPGGRTIGVLPVEVPKSVRRPQLVYAAGENEIRLAGVDRWAEPIEDGLTRAVGENLAALLPGSRVESFPFPPGVDIDTQVSLHVTEFRLDPTVPEAGLKVRWSVYGLEGPEPVDQGVWSGTAAADDTTAAALVGAMSRLVGDVSRVAVRETTGAAPGGP